MKNSTLCLEKLEDKTLCSVTRDLLYVRVQFSDQRNGPETVADSYRVAQEATSAIKEWSGNNLSFTITVKDVKLPNSSSYYNSAGPYRISGDASSILSSMGVNINSYENRSFRYNGSYGSFAGLGQVGGPVTWIKYTSSGVLAHELGHNLGLSHSSFLDPHDNSRPYGYGNIIEYGDPFCNMGSGRLTDWNATQKWFLGYIGGSQVRTITSTSVVTLSSHDNVNSSYNRNDTYLVKIPIGKISIYAEYRKDAGGVIIHVDDTLRSRGGLLIDGNPNTITARDAALRVGQSITNFRQTVQVTDDIKITVNSIVGNKANITVNVGLQSRQLAFASYANVFSAFTSIDSGFYKPKHLRVIPI